MCVTIVIKDPNATGKLHEVTSPSQLTVRAVSGDEVTISEDGTCSCSLLADDATFDRLMVRPDVAGPIGDVLSQCADVLTDGFVLESLWVGDRPRAEVRLPPEEVLRLLPSGMIETRVRYVVRSGLSGVTREELSSGIADRIRAFVRRHSHTSRSHHTLATDGMSRMRAMLSVRPGGAVAVDGRVQTGVRFRTWTIVL